MRPRSGTARPSMPGTGSGQHDLRLGLRQPGRDGHPESFDRAAHVGGHLARAGRALGDQTLEVLGDVAVAIALGA